NQVCNPELGGLPAKSETLRLNSRVSRSRQALPNCWILQLSAFSGVAFPFRLGDRLEWITQGPARTGLDGYSGFNSHPIAPAGTARARLLPLQPRGTLKGVSTV